MFVNKSTKNTEICLEFSSQTNLSREVRLFVYMTSKNIFKVNTKRAFRFQTVVDELYNNAVEHGSSFDNDKIKIKIRITNKFIEFSVTDQGNNPTKKITAKTLTQKIIEKSQQPQNTNKSTHWRWLTVIITNWMDKIIFQDNSINGITVIARKNLTNIDD